MTLAVDDDSGRHRPRKKFQPEWGDGSYYWVPSERRWRASIRLRSGRRVYRSARTEAAIVAEIKKLAEMKRSPTRGARGRRLPFARAALHWLESRTDFEPQTVNTYRRVIARHLEPSLLGKIPLEDLCADDFEEFANDLARQGYSPNMRSQVISLLRQTLRREVRRGTVEAGILALLPSLTTYTQVAPVALNAQQVRGLVDAVAASPHRTLLLVALTTGMRAGEVMALRWRAIRPEEGLITIAATAVDHPQAGYIVQEYPKGKGRVSPQRRRREAVLVPATATLLEEIRRAQARDPKPGADGTDDALVFPNETGGLMRRTVPLRALRTVLEEAGLPKMRLHDLRHTQNSMLAAWHVSREERARQLGWTHGSHMPDTVYRHQTEDSYRSTREAWDDILTPPVETTDPAPAEEDAGDQGDGRG